jgi:hypothetical protein
VLLAVLGTVLGTLAVVLLALNLSSGERKIDHRIPHLYRVGDAQFVRSMGTLLGPPLVGGNTVVELVNGDRIFPAMLEAIRGARRSVTFETYIYWSGRIGEEFARALCERAQAGRQGALPSDHPRAVAPAPLERAGRRENSESLSLPDVSSPLARPVHFLASRRKGDP